MTAITQRLRKSTALRAAYRWLRQLSPALRTTLASIRTEQASEARLAERSKTIAAYIHDHPVRKLQVGAGTNPLPGWLNTDLEPTSPAIIFLDATTIFPFPDQTFDYAFSEHMIEHITYRDGLTMLGEIFRVLKSGGKVRIATPNLLSFIALFAEQKTPDQVDYIHWNANHILGLYMPERSKLQERRREWDIDSSHFLQHFPDIANDSVPFIVNNFFRSFGHQFLYDPNTLAGALKSVGFTQVEQCRPGMSSEPVFSGIDSHARLIGGQMNDFETMVIEAVRP